MDRKLDPGEPEKGNIYEAMKGGKEVKKLPQTLGDAITTLENDEVIKSALTDSENQPPDDLKYSGGIMLVSVTGAGGGSITPLFEALGLDFQSV